LAAFIVDNNLPPDLVSWLSANGLSAFHVRDIGLQSASDFEIWTYAQERRCALITKDRDFDRFALQSSTVTCTVFRLLIGNATKQRLFNWLTSRVHILQEFSTLGAADSKFIADKVVIIE
jgi:predicted nuclease of predicted toxin-antitoxin system